MAKYGERNKKPLLRQQNDELRQCTKGDKLIENCENHIAEEKTELDFNTWMHVPTEEKTVN